MEEWLDWVFQVGPDFRLPGKGVLESVIFLSAIVFAFGVMKGKK